MSSTPVKGTRGDESYEARGKGLGANRDASISVLFATEFRAVLSKRVLESV